MKVLGVCVAIAGVAWLVYLWKTNITDLTAYIAPAFLIVGGGYVSIRKHE